MAGLGELLRLLAEADRDAMVLPGPDPLLERGVVQVAGERELSLQLVLLSRRWVEPVLPRAMHRSARRRYARPSITTMAEVIRGQLMDDHVRPRAAHGLRDLVGLKRVGDHRHSAQLGEHRLL
jgi:hypothetical protein